MKRLLLYVHFNKYNDLSSHVEYQLTQMRPLFSKLVFISNSQLPDEKRASLLERGLMKAEDVDSLLSAEAATAPSRPADRPSGSSPSPRG